MLFNKMTDEVVSPSGAATSITKIDLLFYSLEMRQKTVFYCMKSEFYYILIESKGK